MANRTHRVRRNLGLILLLGTLLGAFGLGLCQRQKIVREKSPLQQLGLSSYQETCGDFRWEDYQDENLSTKAAQEVGQAYLRIWTAWNLTLLGDQAPVLHRYFSGPALRRVKAGIQEPAQVRQRDGSHSLTLTSVSRDGAVLELVDKVAVERDIKKGPEWVPLGPQDESYEVLMLKQDGLWRVEQWRRR